MTRSYALSLMARVATIALQFLIIDALTRASGLASVAVYGSALAAATIASVFFTFGQVAAGYKRIPEFLRNGDHVRLHDELRRILSICLWSAGIFGLPIILVASVYFARFEMGLAVTLWGVGIAYAGVLATISRTTGSLFLSEIIRNGLWRIIVLVAAYLAIAGLIVLDDVRLVWVAAASSLAAIGVAIASLAKRIPLPWPALSFSQVRVQMQKALAGWSIVLGHTVLANADVLLAISLLGAADAGNYFILTRIASLAAVPLSFTNPVIMPVFARYIAETDKRSDDRLVRRNFMTNVIATLGVVAVLFVTGDTVHALLAKNDANILLPLAILLVGQMANAMAGPTILCAQNFPIRYSALITMLLSLAVLVVMAIILIPVGGVAGLAIAVTSARILENGGILLAIASRNSVSLLVGRLGRGPD